MPEMYVKYIGDKPYAYMYGDESAAAALYFGDGYKTPKEALEAWNQRAEMRKEDKDGN